MDGFLKTEGKSADYYRLKTEFYRRECTRYRHLWNKERLGCDSLRRKLSKTRSLKCTCKSLTKLPEASSLKTIAEIGTGEKSTVFSRPTSRVATGEKVGWCSRSVSRVDTGENTGNCSRSASRFGAGENTGHCSRSTSRVGTVDNIGRCARSASRVGTEQNVGLCSKCASRVGTEENIGRCSRSASRMGTGENIGRCSRSTSRVGTEAKVGPYSKSASRVGNDETTSRCSRSASRVVPSSRSASRVDTHESTDRSSRSANRLDIDDKTGSQSASRARTSNNTVPCSRPTSRISAIDKGTNNSATDYDSNIDHENQTNRQKSATVQEPRSRSKSPSITACLVKRKQTKEMIKQNPMVRFDTKIRKKSSRGSATKPPARLDFNRSRNNAGKSSFSPQRMLDFRTDFCPKINVPLHPYTKTQLVQRQIANTENMDKHIHAAKMVKLLQSNYINFSKKVPMGDGENKTFLTRQRLSAGKKYVVVDADAEKNQAAGEEFFKITGPGCSRGQIEPTTRNKQKARWAKRYENRYCTSQQQEQSLHRNPALHFVSIVGKSVLANRSKSISELCPVIKQPYRMPRSVYACH